MMQRRKFMQLLGIGTASAPLAARAAAEAEMGRLAGLSQTVLAANYPTTEGGAPESIGGGVSDNLVKMSHYMKLVGKIPSHVEREIRERTKQVYCFDPDILAKKSWSFSVKIQEQRQRNYQRELARFNDIGWYDMAQEKFAKVAGFRWRLW